MTTPELTYTEDETIKLVEKMLALQKDRQSAKLEEDLDRASALDKSIWQVDAEIDRRVHELSHKGMIYGLTEVEIRVAEGK